MGAPNPAASPTRKYTAEDFRFQPRSTAPAAGAPAVDAPAMRRLADTIRALSIDGVQKANSGHPGLPLGAADMAVVLWYHFLRDDPHHPHWPNRDRFILSAGHGSMLIYSLLHLAGYGVSMDDLKAFRQLGSITPGHPEIHLTPGVEATTGPLGQGIGNAVGMAMHTEMLRARTEPLAPGLIDHFVYAIAGDGDLMEGIAAEAASLAGHLRLGRLIVLYDDNDISLDGPTSWTFTGEDRAARFAAYGWHVQSIDGHDHQAIANAIAAAKADPRPSLICARTVIGYGSPGKAGSSDAHGSPLGPEEVKRVKETLGLPAADFHVPDSDRAAWAERARRNGAAREAWDAQLAGARRNPAFATLWDGLHNHELPADIESRLPKFDPAKPVATRAAGKESLNAIAAAATWLVGGSADLSVSTAAVIKGTTRVEAGNFAGRDLYFGVREHAMGSALNGITTQGTFRAYGGTFLTFSDYMRPAVRLAALSEIPAIYVWTHDSIFLGEDGPTHQPVEHVMSLRAIPNLLVLRPGDATETNYAWLLAARQTKRPTALILTRQNVMTIDRESGEFAAASGVLRGGYVLRRENGGTPDAILIATGSEVETAILAARALEADGRSIRVVSMPSFELFREQPREYRDSVLPPAVKRRASIEAGITFGWREWIGDDGLAIGIDRFGASAPAKALAEFFGLSVAKVTDRVKAWLG